ncbi:MAG: phosphorylase [Rhodospirillales bacterium]|nr:phosphorylase [Rhodospirillales bacterium]
MKLGVVTGLAREAGCLPRNAPDLRVVCAGADPERAESLSLDLIEQGCRALLSFGVAGALAPELRVGDIIVSSGVTDVTGVVRPGAANWQVRVCDGLPRMNGIVRVGEIYGSDSEVATVQSKSDIYKRSGALCVDMESHRMARVAVAHSLPFLAIRVISDDATGAIPSAALGVIGANGRPQIGRVMAGLLRHPEQLKALMELSRNMETAIAQLRRVTSLIGPLFRFA